MIRSYIIVTLSIMLLLASAQPSSAGWPIYSHPEFRGRIIDAETKEPIEGAVAVVYYSADMLIGGPGGPGYYVFHAKECLTDKKGEFYFPSYTSFHLISEGGSSNFIFFKPGYMAISDRLYYIDDTGIRFSMEEYLSTGQVGEEVEIKNASRGNNDVTWKGPAGIVELKKGERDPLIPIDCRSNKLPILFKALNEDRKIRGYKGELK